MVSVLAALEVSDKIQTVGAFAGFAAIVGLAVMSVLYFGQAREVKRLREWAGRAPERAAEMQDRVAQDASRRVVAQPQAQAAPQPAVPARPPAAQPATPGAAAAAAGAAGAAGAVGGAGTATAAPAGTATAPVKPGEVPAAAPGGTDQPTVLQPSVPGAPAHAGTPAGSAPATPGAAPVPPVGGGPTPPAAGPGGPAPAARPETAVPLRSARASRTIPEPPKQSSTSPAGATIAIVGAVAAILVAIVLVVTGVIGGGGGGGGSTKADTNQIVPTTPSSSTGGSTTGTTTTSAPLRRGDVSVVVLNGTGTPNLARNAADALVKNGYTTTGSGNRGDATVAKTLVMYTPGNQRAARDVARQLGVSATPQPLDSGTEVVAKGFASGGTTPEVVVTLGADKAAQ